MKSMASISVLFVGTVLALLFQKYFLAGGPSLEIIAHPPEQIFNGSPIYGLRILQSWGDAADAEQSEGITQLIRYTFTLRNSGDESFPEKIFENSPINIHFNIPYVAYELSAGEPNILGWYTNSEEAESGKFSISPAGPFNSSSYVTFSIYTHNLATYSIGEINIEGLSQIKHVFHGKHRFYKLTAPFCIVPIILQLSLLFLIIISIVSFPISLRHKVQIFATLANLEDKISHTAFMQQKLTQFCNEAKDATNKLYKWPRMILFALVANVSAIMLMAFLFY